MRQVPVETFEEAYRRDADPWNFATDAVEQRRYHITIAALPPRARYRRAFEPACSIGELTRRLALRCDTVVAWDCSPTALAEARHRCRGLDGVELSEATVPEQWPDGSFDLVVLSEVGYYFSADRLGEVRDRTVGSLDPGGALVAVHWLGHSDDHILHGDEVHDVLLTGDGLRHGGAYRDRTFRLDWWERW